MTWALRRQIFYVGVLILFFVVFGFLIISPSFNKAPSCADGAQNGSETGIDCGGSCPRACASQVSQVSVLWARAFKVVPGRYNAVAYIVNHNKNSAVEQTSYRFRFADDGSALYPERSILQRKNPETSFGDSPDFHRDDCLPEFFYEDRKHHCLGIASGVVGRAVPVRADRLPRRPLRNGDRSRRPAAFTGNPA